MTMTAFAEVMGVLARQLRAELDESTVRDYYTALSRYPLDALRTAQEAFSREPGRKWMPTTGEWSEKASWCQMEAIRKAMPPARETPWRDECAECGDTGWIRGLACDGAETGACGRGRPHAAHPYTRMCPCRQTNQTYQRHARFGRGV